MKKQTDKWIIQIKEKVPLLNRMLVLIIVLISILNILQIKLIVSLKNTQRRFIAKNITSARVWTSLPV